MTPEKIPAPVSAGAGNIQGIRSTRVWFEGRADHLPAAGHELNDFGTYYLNHGDDYPDFVIPPGPSHCRFAPDSCPRTLGFRITAEAVEKANREDHHEIDR